MKNNELSNRIKELRNRNGISQEELSEKTGLSLRTIQRIENGETEPRGDSLKRIAIAFNVTPDEIIDWTIQKDNGFIASLNLSALSFIIFPLLGIIIPLAIWISQKDKIQNINKIAKKVLNFQISWTIMLFLGSIVLFLFVSIKLKGHDVTATLHLRSFLNILFIGIMYIYNIITIVRNTIKITKDRKVKYFPSIPFIR